MTWKVSHQPVIRTEPCGLTTEKTKEFFSTFAALEEFRFLPRCASLPEVRQVSVEYNSEESAGEGVEASEHVDLAMVRLCLLEYAKDTLTELSLCVDMANDMAYLGSLREFGVLAKLRVNIIHLLGSRGPQQKPLAEALPYSIKEVTIQDKSLPQYTYVK